MAHIEAHKKKSNLTPQELITILAMLVEKEPAHQFIFKAQELADLRVKGSLKLKCDYYDPEKVFRLSIHEDIWQGERKGIKHESSLMAKSYAQELTSRGTPTPQELITVLYMYIMSKNGRQVMFRLDELEAMKNKGRVKMFCDYAPLEKTFILYLKPDKDGVIITPGTGGAIQRLIG